MGSFVIPRDASWVSSNSSIILHMKQQEWEWWGDLDNLSRPLGTSQVQANSGFPAGQARAREQRQTSSPRARGSLAHTLPHLLDYSLVVLQERLYICLVAPATLPLRILHSSNAGHGIDLFYIFFFPLHPVWSFCTATEDLQYREALIKTLVCSSNRMKS